MRWLARLLLLRVLPKRLIPLLTAWEIYQLVRGLRRRGNATDERSASPAVPATRPGPATRRPPVR